MRSRGFVGFVIDTVEKTFVTHGDSFPSRSGVGALAWLTRNLDGLLLPEPGGALDRVRALRVLKKTDGLAAADLERIRGLLTDRSDPNGDGAYFTAAGTEELLEWASYDLDTLLRAGIVLDGSAFPADSLNCEWGYLLDLDRWAFEVYRGLQRTPPTAGRFVDRWRADAEYHPVTRVASWHLMELPTPSEFLKEIAT